MNSTFRRIARIGVAIAMLGVWVPSLRANVCANKEASAVFAPVAMADAAFVTASGPMTIPVLANDLVGAGGTLALVAVGPCTAASCNSVVTARGGTATVQGSVVIYTPPTPAVTDSFEYTMRDTSQPESSSTARVDVYVTRGVSITHQCGGKEGLGRNGNCTFEALPTVTAGIRRYVWRWGDGTPGQPVELPAKVNHWYNSGGSYTVGVTVEYYSGESVSAQLTFNVQFSKEATWTLVTTGLIATLEDIKGIETFPWGTQLEVFWSPNAADCGWGCGATPAAYGECITSCRATSNPYHRAGTYSAKLRFRSSDGDKIFPFNVEVKNNDPEPDFVAQRAPGDPNKREYQFNPSLTMDDGPWPLFGWEWDFGDGTTYADPDVMERGASSWDWGKVIARHAFASPGVMNVTLKVRDSDGGVGVKTIPVVIPNENPIPRIIFNCAGSQCTFTGEHSTDDGGLEGASWAWNFGDGTTSTGRQVTKSFTAGCHTVTLTMTDVDGGTATARQTVSVGPPLFAQAGGVVVDAHAGSYHRPLQDAFVHWFTTNGNLNGILEPGETVMVEPNWTGSPTAGPLQTFTCCESRSATRISAYLRDRSASYRIGDSVDYPPGSPGADGANKTDCWSRGDCYVLLTYRSNYPTDPLERHLDVVLRETFSDGQATPGHPIKVHVGESFTDVPTNHWAYAQVESVQHAGIAPDCGDGSFCATRQVSRGGIAIWLVKAVRGAQFTPPACVAPGPFNDVPCSHWAAPWVAQLKADGITTGDGTGNYNPDAILTRAEMAIFLLRAKLGRNYVPPPCRQDFSDVACPGHWAAAWISDLKARGITKGCGAGTYCPDGTVDRAHAAAFFTSAFDLNIARTQCTADTPMYMQPRE